MNDIFISYAHPDLAIIRAVVAFLQEAGLNVWFDKDKLLAGQDWQHEIAAQIRQSRLFLVNLSSRANDRRGYFHKEIRTALDTALTIPHNELYFMPVKLDACVVPDELTRYHILDIYEDNGPDMLIKSISHALKRQIAVNPETIALLTNIIRQSSKSIQRISALPGTAITPADINSDSPIKREGSLGRWAMSTNTLRLSTAAGMLLDQILDCDKSRTKGVSFMLLSETNGFYVPYLWDNHLHGALQMGIVDIATERGAAEELAKRGVLDALPRRNSLLQYSLSPQAQDYFKSLSAEQGS